MWIWRCIINTNENKNALSDEQFEKVSGGIDMVTYETIMNNQKNIIMNYIKRIK